MATATRRRPPAQTQRRLTGNEQTVLLKPFSDLCQRRGWPCTFVVEAPSKVAFSLANALHFQVLVGQRAGSFDLWDREANQPLDFGVSAKKVIQALEAVRKACG
jgi:hypothetical protein